MNKPELSDNFTVDDIHKIREYNSEVSRNLNFAEKNYYYNKTSEELLKNFGIAYRKNKVDSNSISL